MNQELELSEQLIEAGFTSFGDIEDLTKEEILDKKIFEYLFSIEDISNREKIIMKLEIL